MTFRIDSSGATFSSSLTPRPTKLHTQARMATATYPPPPPYYRLYKKYLENPKSAPEPPPPIEGTYNLYGNAYTVSKALQAL